MDADNLSRLRVVPVPGADTCRVAGLLADLPPQWRGESIGPGITDWTARNGRGRMTALRLHGLPERLRVELAWMAHWQYLDGVGVHVAGINQIAAVLADAKDRNRAVPGSLRDLDWDTASRMVSVWFEARHQRLPAPVSLRNLRPLFGYPRLALTARLHEGRGGRWTRGIRGATRVYRCVSANRAAAWDAHRVPSSCRGFETPPNGP